MNQNVQNPASSASAKAAPTTSPPATGSRRGNLVPAARSTPAATSGSTIRSVHDTADELRSAAVLGEVDSKSSRRDRVSGTPLSTTSASTRARPCNVGRWVGSAGASSPDGPGTTAAGGSGTPWEGFSGGPEATGARSPTGGSGGGADGLTSAGADVTAAGPGR